MRFFTTKRIVRAATIAAMYAGLTLLFAPISYVPAIGIELRVSEVLTILPLFFAEAIPGLTVGCFIANLFSPMMALDLPFGTLATLVSSILTYVIGRLIKKDWRVLPGVLPPIIINALVVPILLIVSGLTDPYWVLVGLVGAGETIVLVVLGIPFYFLVKRLQKSSRYLQ